MRISPQRPGPGQCGRTQACVGRVDSSSAPRKQSYTDRGCWEKRNRVTHCPGDETLGSKVEAAPQTDPDGPHSDPTVDPFPSSENSSGSRWRALRIVYTRLGFPFLLVCSLANRQIADNCVARVTRHLPA